jgi:dienelactone hydrolase
MQLLRYFLLFLPALAGAQQAYDVTWLHAGKTVHGTFRTPGGPGPFATIILNPGSGANDRHGTIAMIGPTVACLYPDLLGDTLRPYRQLAEALVDSGFAVLRYDKLEYTYTSPGALGAISFAKLWLPVASAINYVKTRPDVDTSRIVLLGHSEGSSIIPFIAQSRDDVSALISLAGPRTPFDSLYAYQIVHFTQLCGGNLAAAQAEAAATLAYFNVIRTNTWNAATPPRFGVPASAWYDYVRATDSVAIRYNAVDLPTLFIGLGNDLNVPPSELVRFQDEITIGADFYSLPGLNHYLTPNDNPNVSQVLTDTIVYWLRQQGFYTVGTRPEPGGDFALEVYPNPFTTRLELAWPGEVEPPTVLTLYNAGGQAVFARNLPADGRGMLTLELPDLPPGLYTLEALSPRGRAVTRLVKVSRR